MRPPFKYYGGKQRLARRIVELMPKHCIYVEPFAGSAAVFFAKPKPSGPAARRYKEVLNDLNGHIVNFFRVLQDAAAAQELLRILDVTPPAFAEYQRAQQILQQPDADSVWRAWAWFVVTNLSFSAGVNSGMARSRHPTTKNPWYAKIHRLPLCIERLRDVFIDKLPAIECIQRWDAPHTLFYCDPPYVGADQGPYSGYTQEEFEQLIDTIEHAQGSFLLSTYENPAIPTTWERFEFVVKCHAYDCRGQRRSERKELVFRVCRNQNVSDEVRRWFEAGWYDCFRGDPSWIAALWNSSRAPLFARSVP